jgi:CYTH domain-containing protein
VTLPNRCRYEVDYTNLIWHIDMHHFHHDGWIIAWIDDRSRMSFGVKFLQNKSSVETAAVRYDVLR